MTGVKTPDQLSPAEASGMRRRFRHYDAVMQAGPASALPHGSGRPGCRPAALGRVFGIAIPPRHRNLRAAPASNLGVDPRQLRF